jgi:hypothetical protein
VKDQWYGDKRDLVKWGALLILAEQHKTGKILQVAYLRPRRPEWIEIDGQAHHLPQSVLDHFRDVRNIRGLRADPSVKVEVDSRPFVDRVAYTEGLVQTITAVTDRGPWVIFLDPDTGLAPSKPGPEHVLDEEVATIWGVMLEGDVLAVYQHQTNRRGEPWIEQKREQLERVLRLPLGSVRIASGRAIAGDVVLLYCAK